MFEKTFEIPHAAIGDGQYFAMHTKRGCVVIVRNQKFAKVGQLVCVRKRNDIAIKRYEGDQDQIMGIVEKIIKDVSLEDDLEDG